jgi:hypothetical protein
VPDEKADAEASGGAGEKPALPNAVPPTLSRFGPAAVDYQINKSLEALIPGKEDTALFSVRLKSGDEERVISGVVAANLGNGWGLAAGATLDLEDRDDYEVSIVGVKSW